jgi:hypothetical protein
MGMNLRIQELLKQTGVTDNWNKADWYIMSPETIEKFAQLIVQECMDAVGDGPMQRPEIQRIKAKFGVEYYKPIEKAFGS